MKSTRIHIVGSGPRTGTTLLAEAMKACFQIDIACDHEESLCTSDYELGRGETILTKYPFEFDVISRATLLSDRLYIICLLRDPRDMIVSKHGAFPDQYWCSLRYWFYFMKYYRRLIKNKKVLVIKYEDFVSTPDKIQEQIHSFIPFLEKYHSFSNYHLFAEADGKSIKALKGVRPIQNVGVGSWIKHLPRVKQQILLHGSLEKSLIATKYEQNNKWLDKLYHVEPINYITKMDEFFPKNLRKSRFLREGIILSNTVLSKLGVPPQHILDPCRKLYRKLTFRL